jgi:hypothetical protein
VRAINSCDNDGCPQVLRDWLGFGSAQEQELEQDGAFGS